MLKPEYIAGAVAVVFVKMSEGDDIHLTFSQAGSELLLEVTSLVGVVIRIVHVAEVNQRSATVFQGDEAAIRVADGKESHRMQASLHRSFRRPWTDETRLSHGTGESQLIS